MTDSCDQSGPSRAEQLIELGALSMSSARRMDLSGLTFISSAGVQLLVDAEVRSRADSQRLALLRGPSAVQRVLEICGVDAALPFATRWAASART